MESKVSVTLYRLLKSFKNYGHVTYFNYILLHGIKCFHIVKNWRIK